MSEIRLLTVPYEACKLELVKFRNENRDTDRDEKYFDWRYLDRPFGFKPIIVWAENFEGKKIGIISLIPHFYMIDNHLCAIGILGDISVSKEWRGKGVSKQMFRYLTSLDEVKKLRACIVLPNEDAARPLKQCNWKTITRLERYVKILNVEERLFHRLGSKFLSKIGAVSFNLFLRIFYSERPPAGADKYGGEVIKEFDKRFDHLWNDLKKEGLMIGLRDKETLCWRFSRHPIIKYQIFVLTQNEKLCGYIIYYLNNGICYIEDFLHLDGDKYPNLLFFHFFYEMRKNRNIFSSFIRTNENRNFPLLRRFGFIKRSDYQKVMLISEFNMERDLCLYNGTKWHLTSGDKDV